MAIEKLQPATNFNKVITIVESFKNDPTKIIPIMQAIQEEYRYLPEEILTFVAVKLGMSPAKVFGIATFYSHFSMEPKGKYIIKVCDGTACHVKGSGTIIDLIREKLQLTEKKNTTEDMLFTLETVSCLGACGLAPVVLINDDVHGQVSKSEMVKLIDDLITEER